MSAREIRLATLVSSARDGYPQLFDNAILALYEPQRPSVSHSTLVVLVTRKVVLQVFECLFRRCSVQSFLFTSECIPVHV